MEKKKSTKELLRESIIELVSARAVEDVTVEMICENCGLSQRTFYNHFRDKHDLITWVYTRTIEDVNTEFGEDVTLHEIISALVHNVAGNGSFYMNAVRYTGQNSFMRSIVQPHMDSFERIIKRHGDEELTDELISSIEFYIFGCIGFMEHHLLQNDIVPADITIGVFERNIPAPLAKYLE